MNDFTPWLESLSVNACAPWFKMVLERINGLGFTLSNPREIEGYRLTFTKGSARVIVDQWLAFPVSGELGGIAIIDDCHSWESTFSTRTPNDVVWRALNLLADSDE